MTNQRSIGELDLPIPHPYWIETWSGRAFDLMNPDPKRVALEDVAMHLSLINRFLGATGVGYSVAQHSVHVAELVEQEASTTREDAFAGLLHDGDEPYLGDFTSPLLRMLYQHTRVVDYYRKLVRTAVGEAFGVALVPTRECVVRADLCLRAAERRDFLRSRHPAPQEWSTKVPPDDRVAFIPRLEAWPAPLARQRFLDTFDRLKG